MSINSMIDAAGRLARPDPADRARGRRRRCSVAIVVGGVVLALAAPLYLPAARAERRRPVAV